MEEWKKGINVVRRWQRWKWCNQEPFRHSYLVMPNEMSWPRTLSSGRDIGKIKRKRGCALEIRELVEINS
jgi:hypothetical protein